MRDRRGEAPFQDYRVLLQGEGEVAFGAAARRRRWLRIGLAAAGVVLILGSFWLYRVLVQTALPDQPTSVRLPVRCVSCGAESELTAQSAESAKAHVCPRCGNRSAYKLWQCHRCGERFVPPADNKGRYLSCPKCQSTAVGTADLPVPAGD